MSCVSVNNVKYAQLGGALVSRIALGCMSFGSNAHRGVGRHGWTLNNDGYEIFQVALDHGINFFDTANAYSSGDSENVTGKFLRQAGLNRSQYVLATKLGLPMEENVPNAFGTSRKHIFESVDASLKRLGVDYVDLLIVHRLAAHSQAEETMEALHDVVKSGRALYIGASSMFAWEFSKFQNVAIRNNWTQFKSMQNHYNLLYREEEREMLPMLHDMNVLCTPWSPTARGNLARPLNAEMTKRMSMDPLMSLFDMEKTDNQNILKSVMHVASDLNVSQAAVSLAWLLHKGCVPVVGATTKQQLEQSLVALDLTLTDEHIEELEKHYVAKPHGMGIGRDPKQWR